MKGLRAHAEAFHALGNLDPPLRGRGELGEPSDHHLSPNPPSRQRPRLQRNGTDTVKGMKLGPGLTFSWKRALGISAAKRKISRATGIPLSRTGRRAKLGKFLGMK